MLSRRTLFARILANREAHELLMNALAVGEADSAVDLDRFAKRMGEAELERKVYRHFAEEQKHARLLGRRLAELGFERRALPPELDYEAFAQRFGLGLPRARLDDERPLSRAERIRFFAGCKVGEERACDELVGLIDALGDDPKTAEILEEIHGDELRHVAYATEELVRLAAEGAAEVRSELRRARRAEARTHRRVTRAFMTRLFALLGVPAWIQWFAARHVDLLCALRIVFPGGLDAPKLEDPMGAPAASRARRVPGVSS